MNSTGDTDGSRKRRRKLVRTVCVCLFVGFSINICIAWLCAAYRPGSPMARGGLLYVPAISNDKVTWVGSCWGGFGWGNRSFFADRAGKWNLSLIDATSFPAAQSMSQAPSVDAVYEFASGWPLNSMSSVRGGADDTEAHLAAGGAMRTGLGPMSVKWNDWQWGIVLEDQATWAGSAAATVLPLKPRLIGFIINTLLYATLAALPFMILAFIRHRRQWWQGRCPECAYDLRSDLESGCPECGWNREAHA